MNQGVSAVSLLNAAHGAAHAAILSLVDQLNGQINLLTERAQKTHQVYAQTEDVLHIKVNNVAKSI
jgi:hypothetical protein